MIQQQKTLIVTPKKRRHGPKKSVLRRVNDWLHLWLGLVSGIIVFIVSITGCFYAFEKEIRSLTEKYQYVEPLSQQMQPPSILKQKAEDFVRQHHGKEANILGIQYPGAGKSIIAAYNDAEWGYTMLYLNPYSGKVLHEKMLNRDFFRIMLMGHYYLWLPPKIGQPVIAWSILIFVLLLITGLVMWWPKNLKKVNRDKSFKIKWKASFKRVNYDLHNVLGFYALVLALVLAVTGLVWGFQWFSQSYYLLLTGGESLPKLERPMSDTTGVDPPQNAPIMDQVWQKMVSEYHQPKASIRLEFPQTESAAIMVSYNPNPATYHRRTFRYFDQYTMEERPGGGVLAKEYEVASVGEKIYRMNYDIHVGAIAGLPGKLLAFFASLICASLPVTGFLIWWGKKKKKKSAAKKRSSRKSKGSQKTFHGSREQKKRFLEPA